MGNNEKEKLNGLTKEDIIKLFEQMSLMNIGVLQEKLSYIEEHLDKKIESLVNKNYKESALQILEELRTAKAEEDKRKYDRRLRNARYLFNNFHNLKTHYEQAIYIEKEIEKEKISDIFDFIDEDDEITMIQSIYRTKRRTKVMIDHITVCVQSFIKDCYNSNKASKKIEADIINYAIFENKSNEEIGDIIGYNGRSVYRIKNKIIDEELSILLFGIDAVRLDKDNLKKKK